MSLRTKLFLLFTSFSATLSALVFFLVTYFPNRLVDQQHEALDRKSTAYAHMLAQQVRSAVAFADVETARETFEGAATDHDILYLGLWGSDGKLIHGHGFSEGGVPTVSGQSQLTRQPGSVTVTAPVVSLEGPRGVLKLVLSTAAIEAQGAAVKATAVAVSLGVFLAGALLAWIMGSSIVQRLSLLAAQAERVARGDVSSAPSSGRADGDEIDRLALSINEMVAKLRSLIQSVADGAVEIKSNTQQFLSRAYEMHEVAAQSAAKTAAAAAAQSPDAVATPGRPPTLVRNVQSSSLALVTQLSELDQLATQLADKVGQFQGIEVSQASADADEDDDMFAGLDALDDAA